MHGSEGGGGSTGGAIGCTGLVVSDTGTVTLVGSFFALDESPGNASGPRCAEVVAHAVPKSAVAPSPTRRVASRAVGSCMEAADARAQEMFSHRGRAAHEKPRNRAL
jgi:hypothetical protein